MDNQKRVLIIEFCNFEDYPIGGLLSFAKNLISAFSNDLMLIGITTNKKDPLGKWFKKSINGTLYDFFALARYDISITKHLFPDRLATLILLNYYRKKILSANIKNVFIQRPDILLAIKYFGFKNICYRFGGLENPLLFSKYWYAKYAAILFDKYFFSCFNNVTTILASGDEDAISQMILRSRGNITREMVSKFPTRISSHIFRPINKSEARKKLNISNSALVISTTGRLSCLKGWKFMIDSFAEFEKNYLDSQFYFIGEGEDYNRIKDYITWKGLDRKIILSGKRTPQEISLYLNASDLYIMGSYKEGWCTTLVEALACGVPICTVNFSSAKEIVNQDVSGYVIDVHDIPLFVKAMEMSLKLNREILPILSEVKKYAISELKNDLLKNWVLI